MIDRKEFESLAQITGQNCISFFIQTHRAGQGQEDRIRYKNMLSEVKSKLINKGLSEKEAGKLLKEAGKKIDDLEFWQHQSDGLAVFIQNGQTDFHHIPISFKPFSYVGDQLYLKPLMPILTGKAKFFLLAISQDSTRLFEGQRYSITEIETDKHLPNGIGDLMKYYESEEQLQQHSGTVKRGKGEKDTPTHHGQGNDKALEEVRLREYMRMINKGVMELMCDDDKEPLILATVEENAAIYREVNEYPNLHTEFVSGNPENEDPVLLHEKAWELMRPQVEADLAEAREQFEPALAKDEASFTIHDIVPSAIAGRVKTLFVAEGEEIWGTYQASDHSISIHEKRQEDSLPLINYTAIQTLKNSGTVYVLPRTELPRPTASVNATYRYSNVPA